MSDQDTWRYAQEMRLDPYNNVEPPRPTLQEWVKNVQIEGGRTPYLPPSTEWEPGRFERPDPNKMPASPFAYNPFRDMQRAPETTPQLPSGDDLSQFLTRQPPRTNLPPTPSPRTSPPAATPPPGNDLSQFLTQQPPRNAELPPTPKTNTPAPIPGETPQAPRAAPQPPTTTRIPPTGAGTPPPPPAAPRVAIPPNNPIPGARPSNIPAPRGVGPIGAGGAIAAGADFTWRIFNGQDPKSAAGGAIAGVGGSVAGSIIGSAIAGPVGSIVGGMVGGYLGGAAYNHFFPPKAQPQQQPYTGPEPFQGGQCPVYYDVYYRAVGEEGPYKFNNVQYTPNFVGPITGSRLIDGGKTLQVYSAGYGTAPSTRSTPGWYNVQSFLNAPHTKVSLLAVAYVSRQDGQLDNCGNPQPRPIPKDERPPDSTYHPGNIIYVPYPYTPDRPKEAPPTNYVPGGIGTRTGGTPRGDSPNWVPHAGPAGSPHPDTTAPPIGLMPSAVTPGSTSSPSPPPSDSPGDNRHGGDVRFDPNTGQVVFTTPGSPTSSNPRANPNEQAIPPVFEANPLTANPIKATASNPSGFTSSSSPGQTAGLPQTGKQEPTQDANREYPLTPQPQPQPQTQTQTQQAEQRIKQLEDKIDEIAIGLVGLTQLFNPVPGQLTGIQNNTTPQAIQDAAATGTCRTLQPGGCMAPLATNAQNAANNAQQAANNAATNNGLLNRIIALLQGLDLALLTTINNKLGTAIPGGLSGGLGRLSKFLAIDRVLNLLTFLSTVHNALMLSNGLKQTLLATLSSIGNATGLLENSEGEGIDLNQVANQGFEQLMVQIFGAEVWANIEINWRKYNRIYQAGANVITSVSSMFNSMGDAIETIGENVGKGFNALKSAGVVAENAYQWFSEKINAKGSRFINFQTKTGQATEFLNVINEIAENVVEGQEGYTEAVKATKEFKEELKKAEKNKGVENELIKKEAEENKKLASKDPTGEKEKGLLSFITDPQE